METGGVRAGLALAALGVVFGDIGTSPIYAFRETFKQADLVVAPVTALGVASLVLWSLIIVISVKYLTLVMRADNHGEGGILALTSLVMSDPTEPGRRTAKRSARGPLITLGVFGTALLYGDGVITPAISVLSAVEGFEVATDRLTDWVIPISIVILVALFAIQHRGTAGIAKVFGPVMVVWFGVLGALGIRQIVGNPTVLRALSPTYAVEFFIEQPGRGFLALGSIFLVVTGGEALYADMGHFGRRPIMMAWYGLVLPGLVCNYFGQAALLLDDPTAIDSPFYRLVPEWGTAPLAVLATCATVIASQALISGAFSLTAQAVALDYLPRLKVRHTSAAHVGQVYVPFVNWALMIGCITLVVTFRSSEGLAAAYGIAVVTTMVITTVLFMQVAMHRWNWSRRRTWLVGTPLLLADVAFLAGNVTKIPSGGWLPLLVGVIIALVMTTWHRGRGLLAERRRNAGVSLTDAHERASADHVADVAGTAVYLYRDAGGAPPALLANLRHNKVLHHDTLLVSVDISDVPRVSKLDRVVHTRIAARFHRVELHFGFLERLDIPAALALVDIPGFQFEPGNVTYFLGRDSVAAGGVPEMGRLRQRLFLALARSASGAGRFFSLPTDRTVEIGSPIDI